MHEMIEMIPEANDARWSWLNERNPDLMSECFEHIKQMILDTTHEGAPAYLSCTKKFEVVFNNDNELRMLQKYLLKKGYDCSYTFAGDQHADVLKYTLIIGIS
jgi:hypothetical protein